jgi:cyanophycin synthetase
VAVELVEALVANVPYALQEKLEEGRRIVAKFDLGPSTKAIVDAASRRGIPTRRVGADSLVRLGYGRQLRHMQATVSDRTASNKQLTKQVLAGAGLPVPKGCVFASREEVVAGAGPRSL